MFRSTIIQQVIFLLRKRVWFFSLFFCPLIAGGQTGEGTEIFYPALIDQKDNTYFTFDEPASVISFSAAGDLMIGGRLLPVIREKGSDYPFDSRYRFVSDLSDLVCADCTNCTSQTPCE